MLKQKNTHLQGNIGLTMSIVYFASIGAIISIPLNDIQDYDLVVDIPNEGVRTVQVKTTRCVERGKYKVELRSGGKAFTNNKSNYLFIVDGDGNQYLIPRENVNVKNAIILGDNYSRYII